MKPIRREFDYGNQKMILETGRVARQATGAVMVTADQTVVLCTVVGRPQASPNQSFFPLTVNYQEKTYATGRIPGSFFRREGRPSEQETLTSRLIDRPIRPLFHKDFRNEVQVVCTVMSANADVPADIPALIGASAALAISGLPFNGPLAAARVGFNVEKRLYLLNPAYSELQDSALNMIIAGTKDAVLMVESEADELPEDLMLGGILFAHQEMQVVIENIEELALEAGKPRWKYEPPAVNQAVLTRVESGYADKIKEACSIKEKAERGDSLSTLRKQAKLELSEEKDPESASEVGKLFDSLHKKTVRQQILEESPRLDGRDAQTVRPIDIEVGILPRAHGSTLFTRGETQAIVTTTLGPQKDAALIENLSGVYKDQFLLHYNFPPYSVGETGFMSGPKRREIGHGYLAKRAVARMLPSAEDFPYTVRIVSEITESNGSSSMASVCGASLSLMDAGVPVKKPIAGIAMGLVMEGERFAVLTDIMGDEDHLGDMDFKVAGSDAGVTALQMDIKIAGITPAIMEQALAQAKVARLHILEKMNAVLPASRSELAEHAPSFHILKIPVDKIRDVIGKGGATIRGLTEETGASIDVKDDGSITIYGETKTMLDDAIRRIEGITAEVEIGKIYEGEVKSVVEFGAFVEVLPGQKGLVHISEVTGDRIDDINDHITEGQMVEVVVLAVDNQGRIKLSMKDLHENNGDGLDNVGADVAEQRAEPVELPEVGNNYSGTVKHVENYGGFVEIMPGLQGLVHKSEIIEEWVQHAGDHLSVGQQVDVRVASVSPDGKIGLSMKPASEEGEPALEKADSQT